MAQAFSSASFPVTKQPMHGSVPIRREAHGRSYARPVAER